MTDLRGEPGDKEHASWLAYLDTGSMRQAARQLGVHEVTIRKHIAVLRQAYGVQTNAQLAVELARRVA